ncbi:MAG TPA: 3-methyl-2-oxobutanoate hydroxymethyltransferase [Aquiluna sp.]
MKIRTGTLAEYKAEGKKFACLTSYDNQTAQIFDAAGIAVLLVGDSASNAVLGNRDTVPITLEEMIPFGRAVANGAKNALVVFDLPFGSYEISSAQALDAGFAAMKQTGCAAVKLEGARTEQIRALVDAGIPVMGHVGFTPQSVHALSGYKVQGRDQESASRIIQECKDIEAAGAFAIVLEMVPGDLAAEITAELSIPTIGIGAGNGCDGQILVWTDFAGLDARSPSFSKQYVNLRQLLSDAASSYVSEVTSGEFPTKEQSF